MEISKNKISKNTIFLVTGATVFFVIVIAIVIFCFYNSPKEIKTEKVNAGNVSLTYTDSTNEFLIVNAVPTSNSVGKLLDGADQYFDFTVNTDIEDANKVIYEISLEKNTKNSTILDDNIVVYLEKQDKGSYISCLEPVSFKALKNTSSIGSKKGSMVIAKVTKEIGDELADNYRLRMWMSDTTLVNEGAVNNFSVKINVNAEAK